MTLAVSIAGAVAVAITARLMYLFFLSGKTFTVKTATGRLMGKLWEALVHFSDNWRAQTFRYKLVAYPCMIVAMGVTSMVIYWLMPVISDAAGFWDKLRYCVMIVVVGVAASMLGAFLLIYFCYLFHLVVAAWWRGDNKKPKPEPATPSEPAPPALPAPEPDAPKE